MSRASKMITLIGVAVVVLWAAPAAFATSTIWWANVFGNEISYANLAGGGGADLNTTGATTSQTRGIAFDISTGRVYWPNQGSNKISFANIDGSGGGGDLNTTGATVDGATGVVIDKATGRIYWANSNTTQISYAKLDGSGGGDLSTAGASTPNHPVGVAIDTATGRIYWADFGGTTISYANLDGSGGGGDLDTTGATVDGPQGVAIDSATGRIYWANSKADSISYANLNGTGGGGDLNTTGATVDFPVGVTIDDAAGKIYWANLAGDKISYANVAGGGGGDLNTTGATKDGPTLPALLEPPSGTAAPSIAGGSNTGSKLSCSQGGWAANDLGSLLYRSPKSYAYQWRRNGQAISGATASTYTAHTTGSYSCTVTATNPAGSASQTSAAHAISTASFHIVKLARNKHNGTARLSVTVSAAGTVVLSGKGIKRVRKTAHGAGTLTFLLTATGKLARTLAKNGNAHTTVKVTYTPSGATPRTKSKRITLILQKPKPSCPGDDGGHDTASASSDLFAAGEGSCSS